VISRSDRYPNEKTVLAIDPGSSKCGMALVRRDESGQVQLLWRKIAEVPQVVERMRDARAEHPCELVIVGNGTNCNTVVKLIRDKAVGVAILVVDEKDTTYQARERYWVSNQRRGWRRFLPSTLQVPPEPIDDFAALILAERVLTAS
jgi:RNase H-fold protein (predicted Holliday junction resolvase)